MTNNSTPGQPMELTDQTMEEGSMSYSLDIDVQGTEIKLEIEIEFDGDTFEGTADVGAFGSFPITGQKEGSPE